MQIRVVKNVENGRARSRSWTAPDLLGTVDLAVSIGHRRKPVTGEKDRAVQIDDIAELSQVHTAFYDPVVLEAGESIYVDSTMGHAYTAEGCDEAKVLAVCSSADEDLMESLISLHADGTAGRRSELPKRAARQGRS